MPLREKGGTYPSRYDGLIYHLDTRTEDELVLGLAETEEIIGRPLPTTAYTPQRGAEQAARGLWRQVPAVLRRAP